MKSVLGIVQETVNQITTEIKKECEQEIIKSVEQISQKYKTKAIAEIARYTQNITFQMSQRFDRSIVELKVVMPDESQPTKEI